MRVVATMMELTLRGFHLHCPVQRKSAGHVARGTPTVAIGVVAFAGSKGVCRVFFQTAGRRLVAVLHHLLQLAALPPRRRLQTQRQKFQMVMNGAQSVGRSHLMPRRPFASLAGTFCISTVLRPWSGKATQVDAGLRLKVSGALSARGSWGTPASTPSSPRNTICTRRSDEKRCSGGWWSSEGPFLGQTILGTRTGLLRLR